VWSIGRFATGQRIPTFDGMTRNSLSFRWSSQGTVAAAFGLAVGLALGLAPAAQAAAVTPADIRPTAVTHTVTLVTGDRVVVSDTGGREAAVVHPRPGATGGYLTQRLASDLYVIPIAALPYVGTTLDRSLFDVSALIRDGISDRVPVQVTGSAPGIVGSQVTSAATFGAALAEQAAKDARTNFATTGPLFGTATSVRLAAPGAPQHARPQFPMHTLRILTTDADSAEAYSEVSVTNVDNADFYNDDVATDGGEARVSLPSGHYTAMAVFPKFDPQGGQSELRLVTTDFTVTDDATITLDARKATSQVVVTTPKPSSTGNVTVGRAVTSAAGSSSLTDFVNLTPTSVYTAPAPPPAVGARNFFVWTHNESPTGVKDPYTYDLKFDEAGAIPADQHFRVRPDQLATLRETYYSDTPNRIEDTARVVYLPYESIAPAVTQPVRAPSQRTEYVLGSPDLIYLDTIDGNTEPSAGFTEDTVRQHAAGSTAAYDWLRGPIAPGLTPPPGIRAAAWQCGGCRQNDTIRLNLPNLDSAGHILTDDSTTSHLQLLSGDTKLIDVNGSVGAATVPATPGGYKVVYDQARTGSWYHQSTASHTEWTFKSAHSGTQTVPPAAICDPDTKSNADCSALPMLTAAYRLDTDLSGSAPAGPDQLDVTFGHGPGGPNLPIAKASVQISFDGGARWTPTIQTALGGGRYRAQWTNPASAKGGDVALRVSATDAAGNTITQSVIGELTITGAQS
jgi:hypothetical protein